MSRRKNLILVFMPAIFLGLLLFLGLTMAVSGDGVYSEAFSSSESSNYVPYLGPGDSITEAIPIYINAALVGQIDTLTKTIYYRLDISPGDINRQFRVSVVEISPDPGTYRFDLSLLDADGDFITNEDTTGGDADLDWTATQNTYYFSVDAVELDEPPVPVSFEILVERLDATETPTHTPIPDPRDECEVNDNINGAWPGGPCPLSVGIEKTDLNFTAAVTQAIPNDDYFTFLAKAGRNYRIETTVSGGADTIMTLYDPSNNPLVTDDDGGVGTGSAIERTLNDGWYKVLVQDRLGSSSPTTAQTYDIVVEDLTADTPTPTSTPLPGTGTPTPEEPSIPGTPDKYEPNYWFDRATLIGLDETITANFVPVPGADPADTDFYKLWVVGGKVYTCETFELGSATNTNIIFCSGPSSEQCFAGNDDVAPFDPSDPYRSRLTFFSSFNGYLYLMLGQVGADRVLPEEWQNLSYKLKCVIGEPGTATPTPTSQYVPTSTPSPIRPPDQNTPVPPTAEPVKLKVLPMTTPSPPPMTTPIPTPAPERYTVEVQIYYDRDGDGQAGADEGVQSVLVRAYDAISGEVLSIDYSDETGAVRLAVSAVGPVRVSVPFFGFNQVIAATNADIQIRVAPQP